jgi:hypothetical protein
MVPNCPGYLGTAALNCQEISKEKEAEEGEKGGSTSGAHFRNRLVLFILTS